MSGTFAYYNPKTNTIEKRQPLQQPQFSYMPHLLNIQPQDINYAMHNTNQVRSYPKFVPYPEFLRNVEEEERLENYYRTQPYADRREEDEKFTSSRPFETKKSPNKPKNADTPSTEFLMMEDLREEDIGRLPDYYKPRKGETVKMSQLPPSEPSHRTTLPVQRPQSSYYDEEARNDFRLVKPEDLILRYRPEEYSMNERILNARHLQADQERTRKLVMDQVGRGIQHAETRTNDLERELKQTEYDTVGLEERKKRVWEELEKKRFEFEANEVMKKIDRAIDVDYDDDYNDSYNEDRYRKFLRENQALFAEADRVLGEHDNEDDERGNTLYTIPETDRSGRSYRSNSRGRGTSAENRRATSNGLWKVQYRGSADKGGKSYNYMDTKTKSGKNMALGRGKWIKTVSEEKTKNNATRIKLGGMYEKGNAVARRRELVVKNPKKVEHVLKEAKAITDLYECCY